ncbi:2-oxo-4-hydroxy-4-carboxy-5-ureidoimidazoline decarboxylase [Litorihabitans aurantiacus]|uniref:2-oxo-4-hydroxy-4-carboxy-5-ureidoimidazoline decarboxylase n=1 Tax=Litorihabitans aurantiacus TaxID=1930061 RepID=A0AA37UGE3_9MICO|nr:2-oxo-4-hydroxy-4-carboxy-5-ureidoimidazoline decarboxylase [Litorihabitans aurantiacus]GMA30153.1 OHCU decarboxylase [Litorihabitans aurantiacus]
MRIEEFDAQSPSDAAAVVAVWAAVPAWVEEVVAGRPYGTRAALLARADAVARTWGEAELDVALADHPRIGDRHPGEGASAQASRGEQASVAGAGDDVAASIAEANAAYEARFGRVFLVRAAGRTPEEILAQARQRLANDDAAEVAEALDQLREIALLRLTSAIEEDR